MSANEEFPPNEGKQCLRKWIIAQVNGGAIDGLRWQNKESMIFQIPWTHKGKPEWKEDIGKVLMEYEKHAGRYKEGSQVPFNYSDSKQRLRSALHKRSDFEHIKDADQPDVRIYRITPRKANKAAISEPPVMFPFASSRQGVDDLQGVHESQIPACVAELAVISGSEAPLSSDLQNISTSEMLPISPVDQPSMIISIETLSKSFGSMELSQGGRQLVKVPSTKKILVENGNCSAVICENEPLEQVDQTCTPLDQIHAAEEVLEHSCIPQDAGYRPQEVTQWNHSSICQWDSNQSDGSYIPPPKKSKVNCANISSYLTDVDALPNFNAQQLTDAFVNGDTWSKEYYGRNERQDVYWTASVPINQDYTEGTILAPVNQDYAEYTVSERAKPGTSYDFEGGDNVESLNVAWTPGDNDWASYDVQTPCDDVQTSYNDDRTLYEYDEAQRSCHVQTLYDDEKLFYEEVQRVVDTELLSVTE